MWSWCGKRYLGGAHGVAGILHMLLQCPPHLLSPDACADVWATIAWLLRLQDKDGNWRTKAPNLDAAFDKNELIQWCHGAPGILMLLCRSLRHPSASRYNHILPELTHAIDKATSLIYRHGLLRKGLGACHGVAGSVFALLTCARLYLHPPPAWTKGKTPAYASHTRAKGRKALYRAVHLAHLVLSPEVFAKMFVPDRPHSLYEGLAGMCCAWAAVLAALRGCGAKEGCWGMPGYDDLML
uniref:Squalene cyclase N-terminal domain-containing protein n=1 Tax=Schizophyllum commune (strain H4-8 / FGSC 9210) TaxID=578458 RepID=D8QM16_SCHCM